MVGPTLSALFRPAGRALSAAQQAWLASESAGGVLLIAASLLALLIVNLLPGGAHIYHDLLHAHVGPELTPKLGPMTAHLWINDGLMAIFFLIVGLEIKREWVEGRLATWQSRRLPFIAAAAGMALPAMLYLVLTRSRPELGIGWAVPAATDIAFALGVLALLGDRVPASLKLLLTAVAIADDMGAVAIIAVAYTSSIDLGALAVVAIILALMMTLNRTGVRAMPPYIIGFALLWYFTLLSGVHATVAGVLAAMTVPVTGTRDARGTLHRLEHRLHPWSAYLIVPIFGFANAGVEVPTDLLGALLAPLPLGIAAGLFIGKQAGIFAAIRLSVALGIAERPRGATWGQLYGVTVLCGIGFTMSLFIGGLAFSGRPDLVEQAKMGVLAGSLLSAIVGLAIMRMALRSTDGEPA